MIIIIILFSIGNNFIEITSWGDLIIVAIIAGIIGYVINFIALLNKNEKIKVIQFVKRKLKRE